VFRQLHRYRRLLFASFLLAWTSAFVSTHLPLKGVALGSADKGLHAIGYAGLATAFWAALAGFGLTRRQRVGLILPVLLLYGVADELTQPWFGREAELLDWVADATGVLAAVSFWELVTAFRAAARRRLSTTDSKKPKTTFRMDRFG
jgi:hypothetical protein